jgi:cytochrome c oxidase subunit 2
MDPQSALVTAGRDAERIAHLFTVMACGALIVWSAVVVIAVHAIRGRREPHGPRAANLLIIGGGVVLPTAVLGALLAYGLPILPQILTPAPGVPSAAAALGAPPGGPARGVQIEVSAKQWWWRVRYLTEAGAIETANELRLPVGQRVDVRLASSDVIHSFWVPSIAGKVDMIPGRITRLAVEPTRTGVFRGVCAEYCGASHALMRFVVVVTEHDEFREWLDRQAQPAPPPPDPLLTRGRGEFIGNGCGACHTVRGTAADGTVGPDLTHVGGRVRLGAGILGNEPEAFLRWIAQTETVKPGVHMPSFHALPPDTLSALAAYLESLQ